MDAAAIKLTTTTEAAAPNMSGCVLLNPVLSISSLLFLSDNARSLHQRIRGLTCWLRNSLHGYRKCRATNEVWLLIM
jgi:hypothetical protein